MKTKRTLSLCLLLLSFTLLSKGALAASLENLTSPSVGSPKNETSIAEEIEKLEERVHNLQLILKSVNDRFPTMVNLTPSTENFSVLNPGVGQIAVLFLSIKAHASGSEFTLGVVNLASSTLTGVEFRGWVSPVKQDDSLSGKMQPIEVVNTSRISLPPNKEIKIRFRVPKIAPENFDELLLTAKVGGISYRVK